MAHHSSLPSSEIEALFRGAGVIGATGKFPEGKLTDEDEGELRVAIGQKDGKVVIDFGKPVAWIGFSAEQAEDIARSLNEHARECRLRR